MGKFWNINPCSLCRSSVHLQASVWIVNCYFYKHGSYRKQKELMPGVDWENSCWVWMRLPNVALEKNSLGWGEQTLREHSELMVGVWENSLEPWDPPARSLQQDLSSRITSVWWLTLVISLTHLGRITSIRLTCGPYFWSPIGMGSPANYEWHSPRLVGLGCIE